MRMGFSMRMGIVLGLYGLALFSIENFHALHLRLERGQSCIRLFDTVLSNDVTMESLLETHTALRQELTGNMSPNQKRFLASFYRRAPERNLLSLSGIERLPVVRWRELNLDRAGIETQQSIARQIEEVF